VEPGPALLARCGGELLDGHQEVETLRRRVSDRVRTAIGLGVDVRLID